MLRFAVLAMWVGWGCGEPVTQTCANGTCVCEAEAECDLPCDAPPCHLDCLEGSTCEGQCANGDCACAPGATCAFSCHAPPCHVECAGDNPSCDGACANGQCTCGPASTCAFTCDAPPCHADCEAGATCSLTCPDGIDGNCSLDRCDAAPMTCPDGITAVCGLPCPTDG